MKNLSITIKFFTGSILILFALGVSLFYFADYFVKILLVERSKTFVAEFVSLQIKQNLKYDDFSELTDTEIFNNFLNKIKTSEILDIKIWDKNQKIIFSNDESIIGKVFLNNKELKQALKGKIEVEIGIPQNEENTEKEKVESFLEIYIPAQFDGQELPFGVVEVYYKMDKVNKLLNYIRFKIFLTIGIAVFVLFLFLAVFFKTTFLNPIFNLNKAFSEIADGNLNKIIEIKSKDEMGRLAESFNKMTKHLKEKQEELLKMNFELENRVKEKLGPYDEKIKTLEEEIYNLEKTRNNLEEKLRKYL